MWHKDGYLNTKIQEKKPSVAVLQTKSLVFFGPIWTQGHTMDVTLGMDGPSWEPQCRWISRNSIVWLLYMNICIEHNIYIYVYKYVYIYISIYVYIYIHYCIAAMLYELLFLLQRLKMQLHTSGVGASLVSEDTKWWSGESNEMQTETTAKQTKHG